MGENVNPPDINYYENIFKGALATILTKKIYVFKIGK